MLQEANSKAAPSSPGKAGRQPLGPMSANSHQHTKKRNAAAKKKLQEDLAEQTALVEQLQSQMAKLQAEAAIHKVHIMLSVTTSSAMLPAMQQRCYPLFTLSLTVSLVPQGNSAPHLSLGCVRSVLYIMFHNVHQAICPSDCRIQHYTVATSVYGVCAQAPAVHCHVAQPSLPCYRQQCDACRCCSNQRLHPVKQGSSSSRQCIKHI